MLHVWWRGGGGERAGGGKGGGTKILFPQQQPEMLIHLGQFLAALSAPTLAWAPALALSWVGIALYCFRHQGPWQHSPLPVHKQEETAECAQRYFYG